MSENITKLMIYYMNLYEDKKIIFEEIINILGKKKIDKDTLNAYLECYLQTQKSHTVDGFAAYLAQTGDINVQTNQKKRALCVHPNGSISLAISDNTIKQKLSKLLINSQ